MKTKKIKGAGANSVSLTTDPGLPFTNEQIIEDAKEICQFLVARIPSKTYQEVRKFLNAYDRSDNLCSFTPEFEKYFEKRLKKLNE